MLDNQFETSLEGERVLWENERLRITKIYDCTKSGKITPSITINAHAHPVDDEGNSLLPMTIAELRKKADQLGVTLEQGEGNVKAKIRRAILERSSAFTEKPIDIPVDKNESKTLWKQILESLPMCALFISDRSSSDQDPEAQSPMGIAVEQALDEVEQQLIELAKHVETRVRDVAGRTLTKLSEMNEELATQLTPKLKDEKIKWKNLFKYTLTSDLDVPMDKRGSGVRRLLLLNFFRAEAERKAQSDDGHRPVIFAIEEPETAQHPDHQRMLMQALLEIAGNSGQVIISTHAPGLAGEVPAESLRLVDKDDEGKRTIRSSDSEDSFSFYQDIAERLGMLPDNLIRILVCVEGWNDIRFLKHISHTLHAADDSLPDLSQNPRFAPIPLNGGNLRDVVNLHLFRGFHKPEYHIYDHDDDGTYQEQVTAVNARGDGSRAVQTSKRTMENYLHADAIERVTGQQIEVSDDNDIVTPLCQALGKKKGEVKALLNNEVAPEMTIDEINQRDEAGEIKSWLSAMATMCES